MTTTSLLDRVASALFGGKRKTADTDADRQLIADMIELVVEEVEPRVRFHARYKQKLENCVTATIAHLRSIGSQPLEPVLLSRKSWNDDPRVNSFFGRADDVSACMGRSRELRAFFEN